MNKMNDLVAGFSAQLKEAIAIGEKFSPLSTEKQYRNIIITGLGGSGIGGTIVSEIISGECKVPVTVNKDYFLPSFTGNETVVIVCSYSGNTEETLQAMNSAIEKNARVVCITSGGKVAELAKKNQLDLILIPGGMPPRACLGYSFTQLLYVLGSLNFISSSFKKELEAGIQLIEKEGSNIRREAEKICEVLAGKIPVIYAVDGFNGVATRFRQQINENSKMLCWHHILPEMNHNELVGWTEKHNELAVVLLRNRSDYTRTQARIEISKEIFAKYASSVNEIWSKGESSIERTIYLIHLTDWISVLLADKKNIDSMEVNVINHLKGELAKL